MTESIALKVKNDLNDPLTNIEDSRTVDILIEILHLKPDDLMNNLTYWFEDSRQREHRWMENIRLPYDWQRSHRKPCPAFSVNDTRNFFQEIETLISLLLRENGGQPLDENEKSRSSQLRGKYHVGVNVKLEHLSALFPHLAMDVKLKTIEATIEPVNKNPKLHPAFYLSDFGGLIPTQRLLKKEAREALIILHLLALEKLKELPIPINIRHTVLKKQMEASQLSDERKIGELVRLSLVYGGGDLTPQTQAAFDQLLQCEPVFCKHVNFKALD